MDSCVWKRSSSRAPRRRRLRGGASPRRRSDRRGSRLELEELRSGSCHLWLSCASGDIFALLTFGQPTTRPQKSTAFDITIRPWTNFPRLHRVARNTGYWATRVRLRSAVFSRTPLPNLLRLASLLSNRSSILYPYKSINMELLVHPLWNASSPLSGKPPAALTAGRLRLKPKFCDVFSQ